MKKILFPSEPYSPKEVDSSFKSEYEAAKLVGFDVFLFDHDKFVGEGVFKSNLSVAPGEQYEDIILRGWMLKEEQYTYLIGCLAGIGYSLLNNKINQYLTCHYFPEAYKYFNENTSKAWWSNTWSAHPGFNNTRDVSWEPVRNMLGGDIIIKDYVKSEKGNPDLFILGKELTNEEFSDRVQAFIDARGKLFNKGLVFKSVENLKKYGDQTNEWRMFFLKNKLISLASNSEQNHEYAEPSNIEIKKIEKIAASIPSNFFTIDLAEKEDGSWMILEAGDGQVSGLAVAQAQFAIPFYESMKSVFKLEEA